MKTIQLNLRIPRQLLKEADRAFSNHPDRSKRLVAAIEAGTRTPIICRLYERAIEGLYEENVTKRTKLCRDLELELRKELFR